MAEAIRAPSASPRLHVQLCACLAPGQVCEMALELAAGASVADALCASGWAIPTEAVCGLWGRVVARSHPLQTGDRVEVYRPLLVDPKVARRQRFARQGTRAAGLFARRRTGGKAGY